MIAGRYVIQVRTSAREAVLPAATDLSLVYDQPTVSLWCSAPIIPLGDRGFIVGHLFTRDLPSRRIERIDDRALNRAFTSRCRSLLRDFWGGYVALYADPDGTIVVLRDPSGTMPCYMRESGEFCLLASEAADLAQLGAGQNSVHYVELARLLNSPDSIGRATCLMGVTELVAGESITFRQRCSTVSTCWTPWDFVTPPSALAAAAETLRETIVECVGCWASCFGNIVLGVSGGLDSSIVAAIASKRSDLRCLTMIGPDADGDESHYASILAAALGVPLACHHYTLTQIDVTRPVLPHLPRPIAPYFMQAIAAAHAEMDRDGTVDAFFSGNGGDNVFCSLRSASPLVDRILARPGLGALHTLVDISDLTETNLVTVLKGGWRKYRHRRNGHCPVEDSMGLTAEAIEAIAASPTRHPWLRQPADALPGKIGHVALLARAQKSVELYQRGANAPHIAPLLSQPVAELCLAIPSWQWITGGLNRSVAREAFRNMLPQQLLQRTSKGGPGGFVQSIYRTRAAELRTMLRDGLLVAHGVLDPKFLDRPDDASWRGTSAAHRLLSFANAECWARWWTDKGCEPTG